MKWHEQITPTQNVYYSVEVLFPEAASLPKMYIFSSVYYNFSVVKLLTFSYQICYFKQKFLLIFADCFFPDKGIFVGACLYFCSINKNVFT